MNNHKHKPRKNLWENIKPDSIVLANEFPAKSSLWIVKANWFRFELLTKAKQDTRIFRESPQQ